MIALIEVAKGLEPADLILKNAKLVNVFSGEIYKTDIAIKHGYIAALGTGYSGTEEIDLQEQFVIPGFIDAHVHIESSMLSLSQFSKAILPLGTTTVIADPHEITNVCGSAGFRYMLKSSKFSMLNVFFMVPSCVPATHLESSGIAFNYEDVEYFMGKKKVLGLAEMMNYPGVINGSKKVMKKILLALESGKLIDGHAPGLTGKDLSAYVASGISSDHECTNKEEALEKLRTGMYIMIREGTGAKNLNDLLPFVTKENYSRCLLATDDRCPTDIVNEGHINYAVKKAIKNGLDPMMAIKMATINVADYFGLKDVGAILPGKSADILVVKSLENLEISKVFKDGMLVAEDGKYLKTTSAVQSKWVYNTVNTGDIVEEDLKIPRKSDKIRVIETIEHQLLTKELIHSAKIENDYVVADPDNDIIKLLVIERHFATHNIGKGFVKGLGIKSGAVASTVSHDSHNLVVTGTNDSDMFLAINTIIEMNGGICVVKDNQVLAKLPLPIAGLMSDASLEEVYQGKGSLDDAVKKLGSIKEDPFMKLAFLSLPVIPKLKLTDKGLVDVDKFDFVDLFVE